MSRFVDLTHKFTESMPVYPGDVKPELKEVATVQKDGYGHFHIKTGMHVGTHIDAPLHFIAGGKKLSEFPVEKFIGRGVLLDLLVFGDGRNQKQVKEEMKKIRAGDIVLIRTGMDKKYREPDYYTNTPVLTPELAQELVKAGVKMVGMDMNGPDKEPFNVHKILLGAEVLIIENLTNLDKLAEALEFSAKGGPASGWEVIALPTYFEAEAAPARVIARIV